MTHVILLDEYQDNGTGGQYAVTFEGTRAQCLMQTHHDGSTFPLAKADYDAGESLPKILRDGLDNPYPGRMLELIPRASLRHGRP